MQRHPIATRLGASGVVERKRRVGLDAGGGLVVLREDGGKDNTRAIFRSFSPDANVTPMPQIRIPPR